MKIIIISIVILILLGLIGTVGYTYYKKATTTVNNPIATIQIKDMGTIKVELYPDKAPNTVANFIKLAQNGFYNGLTFHRTIPDFMIQGGDSKGDGTGSPTLKDLTEDGAKENYCIKGEFIANGYNTNTIRHKKGTISMARADYTQIGEAEAGYNSAGSQFFITTEEQTSLDGVYAAFGHVTEGMDVVEAISNVEVVTRDSSASEGLDKPVNPPVIESITVETFGIDYGMPQTQKPFDYNAWFKQMYGVDPSQVVMPGDEE